MTEANEANIRSEFESIFNVLDTWGGYVRDKIQELAQIHLPYKERIQMNASYRVKDVESYVSKALYRYKYNSPISEITDKVGARIVLLTKNDVSTLAKAIENENSFWSFVERTRNSENEILKQPEVFTYESEHFIVRPSSSFDCKGIDPTLLTCEIQVRTLLQHVYAEVSHDTIYKKQVADENKIKRQFAFIMAFIEEIDSKIVNIYSQIMSMDTIKLKLQKTMIAAYQNIVTSFSDDDYNVALASIFLDLFSNSVYERFILECDDFIERYNSYIVPALKKYHGSYLIFSQPIVLFCMYAVKKYQQTTIDEWPYGNESLEMITKTMNISDDILK